MVGALLYTSMDSQPNDELGIPRNFEPGHLTTEPSGTTPTQETLESGAHSGQQQIQVKVTENRVPLTLEPYQRTNMKRNNPTKRNRRPNLHRTLECNTLHMGNASENYPRFFTITSATGVKLSDINVIKANKEIERTIRGTPRSITETRAGHLILEVKTKEQSLDVVKLKRLDTTDVTVEPHKHLNSVKGTIYYRNQPNYSPEEILEELKQYGVTEIYQTKKRISGNLINQPIYILTFNICTLPQDIKIGWTKCSVRQYIPRPRRCARCQMFGHGANTCREEEGTCFNCGEELHELPCDRPAKCPNCEENHPASSTSCFYFKLEQETLALQCKERIPYTEAKRRATSMFIKPKTTFSDVVKRRPTEENLPRENIVTRQNSIRNKPRPSEQHSSQQPKLTTGKVTLQPAPKKQIPPAIRTARNYEDEARSEATIPHRNVDAETDGPSGDERASGKQRDKPGTSTEKESKTETEAEPTSNQKPPLVQIDTWDGTTGRQREQGERHRGDRKRALGDATAAVHDERAAKRPQLPAQSDFSRRMPPMPPNMPTYLPPPLPPQAKPHPRNRPSSSSPIKGRQPYNR